MYIDSHAHLEGKRYDADRDEVLARAKSAGVGAYLAIGNGDGPDTADCGLRLAEKYSCQPQYPEIWASVGIHPHEASLANDGAYAKLLEWARHPKVIGWGEIGLDYFYDHSPREVQKAVFLKQMQLAQAAKLPIIIHCRPSDNSENAWDDCLAMIAEHWSAPDLDSSDLGGILHCFTGSLKHARRGLDLGFMISFAGNITFPKAQNIRDAAQFVPLDRMLIETDSPYLAPIPHRGQRNEPSYVIETARQIGQLRGLTGEEVGRQTVDNFSNFFKLSARANG
jgi:TatD DNase family protein